MINIKYIFLITILLILSSCWAELENSNEIGSINSLEINNNVENNNINNINSLEVNNNLENKRIRTDDILKEEIINSFSKISYNIKEFNKKEFEKNLNDCDNKKSIYSKDPNICKNIVVSIASEEQKDISICNTLKKEKEILRCKTTVISKLVAREMNPKYCEELEDMENEMCLEEYNNNINMEIENIRILEDEFNG